MTSDEHAHVQELEGKVKRYRARIVTLKELNGELLAACKALQMEAAARHCGLLIADEAISKAEAHGARGIC